MGVEFKDYYATLGVAKTASQEDIKKAFRKLARTCHPDLAKSEEKESAEARFKEINEAYEVLKDPEKRSRYDQLGANWQAYGNGPAGTNGTPREGRYEYHFGGTGFSDFFERFFGGMGGDPFGQYERGSGFSWGRSSRQARGRDAEAEIMVTLEEADKGAKRTITLRKTDSVSGSEKRETLNVSIPAGVREGQRIRLAGQGDPSGNGGKAGDLFLKVRFAQHPYFTVKGDDLYYELRLAPWEAVLGTTVHIPTLGAGARLRVKAGVQDGTQLRLARHGLRDASGGRGDLFARVSVKTPRQVSEEERALWEQLSKVSRFDPRA